MATFGAPPPLDPLADIRLAISDIGLLYEDAMAAYTDFCCDRNKEARTPRAERYEPIEQARRDDRALPQTRFGDYPGE